MILFIILLIYSYIYFYTYILLDLYLHKQINIFYPFIKMKMKKSLTILLFLFTCSIATFGQFDPSVNHSGIMEIHSSSVSNIENDMAGSIQTGITCVPNSFWAVYIGQIVSLTLNGNEVINNGNVMPSIGNSLAFCNNLDGGSFTPTFYTNKTSTRAAYYNGTGWTTCSPQPKTWIVNSGGNGNFLYFTAHDSVTYDPIGISRYDGTSYNIVYNLSDTSRAVTVADLVTDEAGNLWFFVGNRTSLASDTLNMLSPSGQLLKQYPFQYNTDNAYGCIMMNGVIYIGLGGANPDHPYTLIPVTIKDNTAIAGTPIPMPANSYADLASCTPGSPLTIKENPVNTQFSIYPNPANDYIRVLSTNPARSLSTLRVYNSLGIIVFRKDKLAANEIIDISGFPSGIYYIMIDESYLKIIKQ